MHLIARSQAVLSPASLQPKCSSKNRKRLKLGSKGSEGMRILLSLRTNSLVCKGLLNSHFGQPWNYHVLSWSGIRHPWTRSSQENHPIASAALLLFLWPSSPCGEKGMVRESPPCLLLRGNEAREEVFPLEKKCAAIERMELSQLLCAPELCCGCAYS